MTDDQHEQAITDMEAALHDVVDTVRTIDADKHWRNNLCVRLERLRLYAREVRKTLTPGENNGR